MNHYLLQSNKEKGNTKKNKKKTDDKKHKNRIFIRNYIYLFFIPLIIFINIYLSNDNSETLELSRKIEELELKIQKMQKETIKKKVKIAFLSQHYLNGISRFLSILSGLLLKTGKYDVYLIRELETNVDFIYNKKIKCYTLTMDYESFKDFEEENDIDIYIFNNEISNVIDLCHSFGKKVIEIFHGAFLSSAFQNNPLGYHPWKDFYKLDAFVHIIPDDYWIYKKFGFNNTIYIPNVNTFESKIHLLHH